MVRNRLISNSLMVTTGNKQTCTPCKYKFQYHIQLIIFIVNFSDTGSRGNTTLIPDTTLPGDPFADSITDESESDNESR